MTPTPELRGVIPPLTTPFTASEEIDFGAVREQVRWMLDAGATGVCAGGSTGEGHTLESHELASLWRAVHSALEGQAPLIAGIIVNSTRQALDRCQMAFDSGAVAALVTAPHSLFRPTDDALIAHFAAIAEATPLPVLIDNVLPGCHLSPAALNRILREVPGVLGVKQSHSDLKMLADLLLDLPPGKLAFSAIDALLVQSFALGARGAIAAISSALPAETVQLWHFTQKGDPAAALALHWKLLRVWNAMAGDNLPACVKYVQSLQGIPAGAPRRPMPPPSPAQEAGIRSAFTRLKA